jgi:hypothetical protein
MHGEDGKYPFEVFRNEEKERLRIIEMRQCDAERSGVNRGTRWRMKRRNDENHEKTVPKMAFQKDKDRLKESSEVKFYYLMG